MLAKTHPSRAAIRKSKADRIRAGRHFERVLLPRITFIEETVVEQVTNGKMTKAQATEMLEREFLAIGMEPDVSAVWQALQ
jgi:hypothetical protein